MSRIFLIVTITFIAILLSLKFPVGMLIGLLIILVVDNIFKTIENFIKALGEE